MIKIILTFLFSFVLSLGLTQDIAFELSGFDTRSITKSDLAQAKTLIDIQPGFPESWISGYRSVNVTLTDEQSTKNALGSNSTLTASQLSLIKNATIGTQLDISVEYSVKNSINKKDNERKLQYSYTVVPDTQASFLGGSDGLRDYIRVNAISKISTITDVDISEVTIRFSIDINGNVVDPELLQSSKNEIADNIILKSIQDMPEWSPAIDAFGNKVDQVFTLKIGSQFGC